MIPQIFRRPTPAELVARQLATAELHRLSALAELEQHLAYCRLLHERIARLRKELSVLAAEKELEVPK